MAPHTNTISSGKLTGCSVARVGKKVFPAIIIVKIWKEDTVRLLPGNVRREHMTGRNQGKWWSWPPKASQDAMALANRLWLVDAVIALKRQQAQKVKFLKFMWGEILLSYTNTADF